MKTLHAVLVVLGLVSTMSAADWPQWLGPNRDGHSPEKELLKEWPKGGLALAWKFGNAGVGYSSPAVVGDRVYILGGRGEDEELIALNAADGKEVWKLKIGPIFDFRANTWGKGPRATASVANGHVYAMGGYGDLVCADAEKGTELWRVSMAKDLKGEVNPIRSGNPKLGWGYSWSPLVDGDRLICYPGGKAGSLAALDLKKGEVIWRSKDLTEKASYASPIVAEIAGVRQYVVLHNNGLSGVEAKSGKLLWSWEKSPSYDDVVMPTPIYHNSHVYVSAGYTPSTCDLIEITQAGGKFSVKNVYDEDVSKVMKNTVAGSVLVDGHVYGYSEKAGWVCQEFKSGNRLWANKSRKVLRAGSVTYADGHLYCYGEDDGQVALLEVSTKDWKEKGRFALPEKSELTAPNGKHWTPPVIANGHLLLRDQELLFCYKIK